MASPFFSGTACLKTLNFSQEGGLVVNKDRHPSPVHFFSLARGAAHQRRASRRRIGQELPIASVDEDEGAKKLMFQCTCSTDHLPLGVRRRAERNYCQIPLPTLAQSQNVYKCCWNLTTPVAETWCQSNAIRGLSKTGADAIEPPSGDTPEDPPPR